MAKLKEYYPRYFLELIVIIFGVTVSFMLNEWRENRKMENVEISALETIRDDMIADTLKITEELKMLNKIDSGFVYLFENLEKKNINTDSLITAMGYYATYSQFYRNDIGYQQLKETGQLQIISNKELLKSLINLYVNEYLYIDEYTYIDKKMTLEDYLPFFMKEGIYGYFNRIRMGNEKALASLKDAVYNKEFYSSLIVNKFFKQQLTIYYLELKQKLRDLIIDIEQEINSLK